MVKSNVRNQYWRSYYDRVKKHRVRAGRVIKICKGCNEPIINPKSYRPDVHMSDILNVKSKCQIKRDRQYRIEYTNSDHRKNIFKKPDGLYDDLNIEGKRICLKCDKKFKSKSVVNRICDRCALLQPCRLDFHNVALETSSLSDFLSY